MSSLALDWSRCAASCCEVREACARFMDRDGAQRWVDYSLLGQPVTRIEDCESAVAMNDRGQAAAPQARVACTEKLGDGG